MDREQLEAGRDLDRLIAEQVMGLQNVRYGAMQGPYGELYYKREGEHSYDLVPAFSSEMEAAWTVVERMQALGCLITVGPHISGGYEAGWQLINRPYPRFDFVRAPTAPLVICRAALKGVVEDA